jgi:hypothetical protein
MRVFEYFFYLTPVLGSTCETAHTALIEVDHKSF